MGKLCTSVPEQLGLRKNAAFPVVGVEKMEFLLREGKQAYLVGVNCV